MLFQVLCFISSFFLSAHCGPVMSCEDGEVFWCRSLTTARQCDKFTHCVDNVWGNLDITTGCVSGRKAIEQIQNGATESACDGLTSKYKVKCKDVVNSSTDVIEQLRGKEIHPRNIAKLLGLCSSLKEPDVCKECKAFVNDLKLKIAGHGLEPLQYFKALCANFGSAEKKCNDIFGDWFNKLEKIIKYDVPFTEICELMRLCDEGADLVKTNQIQMKGAKYLYGLYLGGPSSQSCRTCKSLVKHTKEILERTDLQQTTSNFVASEGCPMVPRQLANECRLLVTENTHFMFQLLADLMSEEYLCEAIEMCRETVDRPSALALFTRHVGNYIAPTLGPYVNDLTTSFREYEKEISLRMNKKFGKEGQENIDELLLELDTKMKQDPNYLSQELANLTSEFKESQKEFKKVLLSEISKSFNSYKNMYTEQFNTMVEKYFEQFKTFDKLRHEISKKMEIVKGDLNNYISKNMNDDRENTVNPSNSLAVTQSGECTVCTMMIKQLMSMVSSNKTKETILQDMNNFCNNLPDPLGQQCRELVKNDGTELLQKFIQMVNPSFLCKALGFCLDDPAHQVLGQVTSYLTRPFKKAMLTELDVRQSSWCKICELIAEVVNTDARDVRQSPELGRLTGEICRTLTTEEHLERCINCARRVESVYFDILVELSLPSIACTGLGVCEKPPSKPTDLRFEPEH